MGLFDSKKVTTSTSNNYVEDYSGATFDQSSYADNTVNNEYDNSINGEFAGVTGNVTVTDGGAFNVVQSSNSNMAMLSSESFDLAESFGAHATLLAADLGNSGISAGLAMSENMMMLTDSALSTNAGLVDGVTSMAGLMAAESFSSAGNMLDSNLLVAESMFNTTAGMFEINAGNSLEMQKDSNNTLTNGFKSMMQFADNVSRSDGANLAKSTNQTFMVLGVAGVIGFIAFKKWG